MKCVTVVGLGLIGGSIAKALRQRLTDVVLLGIDRREVGVRSDVQSVVSRFIAVEEVPLQWQAVKGSDLVVLCQPVSVIAETVASYLAGGMAVTDTGSTKRLVTGRATGAPNCAWFVPGHPMAGVARGGFENASASLFEGRPWILCTEGRDARAIARVEELVELLGSARVVMTPEEHDAAVAITSHVPQLLSSLLQVAGDDSDALAAAGPTFLEMTRTAGGAESMWRDIFETNAEAVGEQLRELALTLSGAAEALLANPPNVEVVLDLLRRARVSKTAHTTRCRFART
jgi:prephenate dehydrogenase